MAVLGFDGTLTIDGANPGFTNLRFGFGHTEVDATTQLDGGNKAYTKGLFDKYIGADMNIDESAACATVLAAVQSREPVTCTATLGSGATAITITGPMMVFGGEISTGLDEIPSMSVTCRPAPAASASSGD
ncbi:MAG: hypothetical protein Q4A17_03370 [Thermoguttaceae bacterium]|nr:hypothetical protein [Thermoguttaceae bacterium]